MADNESDATKAEEAPFSDLEKDALTRMDPRTMGSVIIERLIEEVRNEQRRPSRHKYNRFHNRHNRG